jgi:hypothetical protein
MPFENCGGKIRDTESPGLFIRCVFPFDEVNPEPHDKHSLAITRV